ncbi:MAG: recombinase family protein [Elusimicrobiaceae bacterium]|nr:recombinase family protein [Elusimicrobiaceae bacterium]
MTNNNQNTKLTATKAVILARVSSRSQEDGYSLDAQTEMCRKYATQNNLQVVKEYQIVESSTQGARKEFNKMIQFVSQQKGCTAVIAHTVDRFQRRFNETVACEPFILASQMELHFVQSNLVINSENYFNNALVWDVNVMGARAYINAIKVHTRKGIARKIEKGEWPCKAPVGYKNVEQNGKKTIIIDPVAAPLVQKFFQDYATGNYSLEQASRDFKKAGLISCRGVPFNAASMQRTLTNPFYYGIMNVKGALRPHSYGPLISKQLFDKCQQVREGFNKQPLRYDKLPFTFKRMIKCADCESYISSYHRYKKNKTNNGEHHYVYLRCAGKANNKECSCGEIREEVATKAVMETLKAIQVPPALLKGVLAQLIGKLNTQEKAQQTELANAQRRLGQIAKEKEVWIQKEAAGLLPSQTVNEKLQALAEEEKSLQAKLSGKQKPSKQVAWTLARAVNLLSRLPELYAGSQNLQKRKILNLLFANLLMKGKSIEIIMKKPFSFVAEGSKYCVWGTLLHEMYNYFAFGLYSIPVYKSELRLL